LWSVLQRLWCAQFHQTVQQIAEQAVRVAIANELNLPAFD
jgi:hypothetical protein